MPVTAIDPRTALIVIDLQKGIVALPTVQPVQVIIANALRLIERFRAKALPVVFVRVAFCKDGGDVLRNRNQAPTGIASMPPSFFEFIDELAIDPDRDIVVTKRQWGSFYGTDLELQLRRRKITQLVMCGISTSFGVESTARDAWERSFNLTFATDAMTDRSAEGHDRALSVIFPRLGELGTTSEILELMGS